MKNLILLLFFLSTFSLFAQNVPLHEAKTFETADPESVGMSSDRLARIDRVLNKAIADQNIPGAVALVARKGKIVYHKAFGKADLSTGEDLETNDIFRIASQTKAITATAVMMLWEEGHFRLDDPIHHWIPEFKNPVILNRFNYADTSYTTKPANKEITIRHLLTHTSGIGYGLIDPNEGMRLLYQREGIKEFASMQPLTTAENVKKIAKMPLHFKPGEKYLYGMGLDVLVHLVEIISEKPFDQFLKERLFDPLRMENTYFYLPEEKESRLVAVHSPTGEKGAWEVMEGKGNNDPDYPIKAVRTLFSGGAGLSNTVEDYALFLQMYLNGGQLHGNRILSRTTIQSMMGNQIGDLWGDGGAYYGLAFGVLDEKGQARGGRGSVGTFDWGGYFNTQYFADPEEELIGVLYKQTFGGWGDKTGWQFRQLVGQAVLSEEEGQALKVAKPIRAGMAKERLERIDRIINDAIDEKKLPGAVALVARNGKIVYHKAFGEADAMKGIKMQKDHIFRIASQTKAITATAVMMLWEEGHFQLDNPIHWWIPEFKKPKVLKNFKYADNTYSSEPAKSEITIRQLLTHTSGIGYGVIDPHEGMRRLYWDAGIQEFASRNGNSTADNVKKIAEMPLHFHPGEKYQYGMGLDVLVYFVEIVSGMPFDQFVKARLFDPMGMEDTYFHMPQNKADRLVTIHTKKDGQWAAQDDKLYEPNYPLTGNKDFCSGGAGLVSTAKDYATFLQMYLNGGSINGNQILSPTTIKSIMANQIGDFWGTQDRHYGLAFGVLNQKGQDSGGRGSTGTFDWGGYFNTSYFADPQEGIIGIIMKQTRGVGEPSSALFRRLVGQAVDD